MLHADLEAAKLPKVGEDGNAIDFYSFRHSGASWLVAAGVDIVTVAAITDHDPAILLKRYAHSMTSKTRYGAKKCHEANVYAGFWVVWKRMKQCSGAEKRT